MATICPVLMTDSAATYLVSIIISFLNEEIFLSEAINSVLNQEYTNWELILVDDGSSDRSTKIARDYALAYPGRIIYLEHPRHANQGLSASRNYGVSRAKGEFIAILDADDIWSRAKLRLQVALMNKNPEAAMLCEASEYWYSWNKANPSGHDKVIQVGRVRDKLFQAPQLAELLYPLGDGAAPCPSGVIMRKRAFDKHKGFEAHFTGKFQLYEDQAFFSKIYLNEPVYISSGCNNKYRQREGSLVQKVTYEGNYAEVRKYFLEWLQMYISENNIHNSKVERLLKRALEPFNQPTRYFVRNISDRIMYRFKNFSGIWARLW